MLQTVDQRGPGRAGPRSSARADDPETVELLRQRIAARPAGDVGEARVARDRRDPVRAVPPAAADHPAGASGTRCSGSGRSGTIDHDVIEEVLASLDIEESMLTIATERADELTEEPVATPEAAAGPCEHLDTRPADIAADGSDVCEDCVREGTRTVHLRICLTCGNVGCCDSSVGRHAERHFRTRRPPGDAQLRAGRVLALVLPRRAGRLMSPPPAPTGQPGQRPDSPHTSGSEPVSGLPGTS